MRIGWFLVSTWTVGIAVYLVGTGMAYQRAGELGARMYIAGNTVGWIAGIACGISITVFVFALSAWQHGRSLARWKG